MCLQITIKVAFDGILGPPRTSQARLRAFEGHLVSLERPSLVRDRDESKKENIGLRFVVIDF